MTLKTRRVLFYFFAFLFFVAAFLVVLYSRGYRFSFEDWRVTEIGGIYIKSEPPRATIFLNDEPTEGKTGIFQSGTLITNLTPDDYSVRLTLDGYHEWRKNVPVRSGDVAVFDYIILVPEAKGEIIASSTDAFYAENNRILTKVDGKLFFDGTLINGSDVLYFTPGGTVVSIDQDKNYYLSNIFDPRSSLNLNVMFNNLKRTELGLPGEVPIIKLTLYPFNDRRFVAMSERALYSVDTERLTIEQIDVGVKDFTIAGNELIWVNENGVHSLNLVFRTRGVITPLPGGIDAADIQRIDASAPGAAVAILKNDQELILFLRDAGTFTTPSRRVTDFAFAPNGNSIVFVENDSALFVYFLTEIRKGEMVKLIDVPGVRRMTWHRDSAYVFLLDRSNSLRFIEVDLFSPANEVIIGKGVRSFAYDEDDELLYYDDGTGIRRMEI